MAIRFFETFLLILFLQSSHFISQTLNGKNPARINSLQADSAKSDFEITLDKNTYPYSNIYYFLNTLPGLSLSNEGIHMHGSKTYQTGHLIGGFSFSIDQSLPNNIPFQSLDVISLRKNSFSAEKGNYSSGLIEYEIKKGTDKLEFKLSATTDNLLFKSGASIVGERKFLGAYSYGQNEFNLSASGRITKQSSFFINLNYQNHFDKNPLNISKYQNEELRINIPEGPIDGASSENGNIISRFDYELSRDINLKLESVLNFNSTEIKNNYFTENLSDRVGNFKSDQGFFNLSWQHFISNFTSYEFILNYSFSSSKIIDSKQGDDFWNYGPYSFYTADYFNFIAPNSELVDYKKTERDRFGIKGIVKYWFNENTQLKIGAGLEKFLLRKWSSDNQHTYSDLFIPADDEIKKNILLQNGVNNYGFDILGNRTDESLYAPFKPVFFNTFIELFYQQKQITLTAGLRYDLYDYHKKTMTDPQKPENVFYSLLGPINKEELEASSYFSNISPRFNLTYKVNEQITLSAGYGIFYQPQQFDDIYQGIHRAFYALQDFKHGAVKLNNPAPLKTKKVNILGKFKLTNNTVFALNIYRNTCENILHLYNQITSSSSPFSDYTIQLPEGEFTSTGFESVVKISISNKLNILASIDYYNIKETKNDFYPSYPPGSPIDGSRIPYYNSITLADRNLTDASLTVNYKTGINKSLPEFLNNLDFLISFNYNEGMLLQDANANQDYIFIRASGEPTLKISNISSSILLIDFMVEKKINFSSNITGSFFISISNILNSNTFLKDLIKSKLEQNKASDYNLSSEYVKQITANEMLLLKNLNYTIEPPRQIKVGVRIDY